MTNPRFRSDDYRKPLAGLPRRLLEDMKAERDMLLRSCMLTDDEHALFRSLGASSVLDELVNLLENGVPAPAPDAGISGMT